MRENTTNVAPQVIKDNRSNFGWQICFGTWTVAEIAALDPLFGWWVAWLGSVFLLVMSLSGYIFPIPTDIPWRDQTLRPWFMANLIFVGYTFLTSIFYWLDVQGYSLAGKTFVSVDQTAIQLASRAQLLYLIGHVGYLLGMILSMNRLPLMASRSTIEGENPTLALVRLSIFSLIVWAISSRISGLSQVSVRCQSLLVVSGGVSLALAYRFRSHLLPMAVVTNLFIAALALSSGWKEEVLVLVLLNALAFFPKYPRITTFATALIFLVAFVVLPSISQSIRKHSWGDGVDRWTALSLAIDELRESSVEELSNKTWRFLSDRLSEEGLFVRYIDYVPGVRPYYGSEILLQAAVTPIPRIVWNSKPNIEKLVHVRVVELGVIDESSDVSAKPQFVVDGYLSYGKIGVLFATLVLGFISHFAYWLCERQIQSKIIAGVVFNGIFSIVWHGTCFEFFVNNYFWSVVFVLLIPTLLQSLGLQSKLRTN